MLEDKIADRLAEKLADRMAENTPAVPGSKSRKYVPQINSKLRHHILKVPEAARKP